MYKLTQNPNQIIRLSDGATIPKENNGDWQLYESWLSEGYVPDPANPLPESVVIADWAALCDQILGGVLNGVYTRLTEACFLNPATATLQQLANANNIAVAAGKLDQAVAVTRVEGAVAASFQLVVTTSDYRFMQAEKDLWNAKVTELNFTSLMLIT